MVQKTPPTLFWEKCHNGAFAVSNQHHYDFSPEQTWSTFMTFLLLSRNRTIMTFLQNRHAAPLWLFSFFPKTAPLWLFSRTDMQHLCDFSPEQTCSTFVTFLQLSQNRTIMTFLQNRHAAPLWLFSFFPKTAPLWLFSRTDMQHHCDSDLLLLINFTT